MSSTRIRPALWVTFTVWLLAVVPSAVWAQAVTPFQIVGHIESFVLDPTVGTGCPASNIGARMTVNGIDVIIPCHSVILFPAAYKTPRQIFDDAKGDPMNRQRMFELFAGAVVLRFVAVALPVYAQTVTPFQWRSHHAC